MAQIIFESIPPWVKETHHTSLGKENLSPQKNLII